MSTLLREPRPLRLLAAAVLAGAFALCGLTANAQAAFTTAPCAGDPIAANGASFQTIAQQNLWSSITFPGYCNGLGAGNGPAVTYTGDGSGAGISGSKSRTTASRLFGTDDPITPQDIADANAGTAVDTDNGKIRTIPLAVGADAVTVNLPNLPSIDPNPQLNVAGAGAACSITQNPDGTALSAANAKFISDAGDANRVRLQLSRAQVEAVFSGALTKWSQLVPWINDGNATAAEATDTFCQNFPLTRVVRFDSSGTTFILKDYLSKIAPAVWNPLKSTNAVVNRTWPDADAVQVTTNFDFNLDGDLLDGAAPANETGYLRFQRGAANGNGQTMLRASAVDGSVSYADLATARTGASGAFGRAPGADDKYWVKLQNAGDPATATFSDPAVNVDGFLSTAVDAQKGANCQTGLPNGIPVDADPTLGSWQSVSAADTSAYGACGVTYGLAFDDYKGVFSSAPGYNEAAEERKARTVKDYLTAILTQGQTGANSLTRFDYSPLPASLLDISKAAVASIDWGKTPSSGGGGGGGGTTTPAPETTTPPVTTPTVTPPSNVFTLSKPRSSKGSILLSVQIPGAGSVKIVATAKVKGKTITVGSGSATRTAGGTVKLTIKPSAKAKAALKKGTLKVSIRTTFTPKGGTAKTSTASLTLKKATKKK